jgi:alanine racemase
MTAQFRPTTAVIDAGAIAHNVAEFVREAAPAIVCATVKANGYGHGAITTAQAALTGGASWFAVALVEEALELREAGITVPVLLLSEFPFGAAEVVVSNRITATLYSNAKATELNEAATKLATTVDVHIKIDTGMHRVGVQPDGVVPLSEHIATCTYLRRTGTFTHLAVADEPNNSYTGGQLDLFEGCLSAMRANGFDPGLVHASNSAGAIVHARAMFGMVRAGISMYGMEPSDTLNVSDYGYRFEPVMRLQTAVSHVKVLPAGERISYGLIHSLAEPSVIATLPIGYADGIPRRLSAVGGEVLIRGCRLPIIGRVTMDQIMINCGSVTSSVAREIAVGDEAVLIGSQGTEQITPWEIAKKLDTISYEITCGISYRVPRRAINAAT